MLSANPSIAIHRFIFMFDYHLSKLLSQRIDIFIEECSFQVLYYVLFAFTTATGDAYVLMKNSNCLVLLGVLG